MNTNLQKYSNTTVFICIAFLSLFIILPPVTRVIYKDEEMIGEADKVEEESVVITELTCLANYLPDNIRVSSVSTFSDGKFIDNTIKFSPNFDDGLVLGQITGDYRTELTFLQKIPGIIALDDSGYNFQIDESVYQDAKEIEGIENYYGNFKNLRATYESKGYICTVVTQ